MSYNKKEISEIPEVAAFEESKQMLEAFKTRYIQIFESYEHLVADANQKLEAADKVVRAKEISCGDWDLYQYQTKVDAEALFNALGMDKFLQVGGKTTTKTVYDADKARIEASAARGDISKNIATDVLKQSPRYHAPKSVA